MNEHPIPGISSMATKELCKGHCRVVWSADSSAARIDLANIGDCSSLKDGTVDKIKVRASA